MVRYVFTMAGLKCPLADYAGLVSESTLIILSYAETSKRLQCWADWNDGEFSFLLLSEINKPPRYVMVSFTTTSLFSI